MQRISKRCRVCAPTFVATVCSTKLLFAMHRALRYTSPMSSSRYMVSSSRVAHSLLFSSASAAGEGNAMEDAPVVPDDAVAEDGSEDIYWDVPYADGMPRPSERVKTIARDIMELNTIEMFHLQKMLMKTFGVTEEMLTPTVAAVGGAAPAAAEEEVEEEEVKTHVDLKLEGFEDGKKIKVIKEVRAMTGLGLKQAKDLVDGAPCVVKENVPVAEADELIEKLKAVGASVAAE